MSTVYGVIAGKSPFLPGSSSIAHQSVRISGAAVLRRRNGYDGFLPASLSTVYLVLAILYFFCSAIELFGVVAAWKSSIKLVRSYFYGAASVAIIVTAAEVMRLVVHYTQKSAILKACQDSYVTEVSKGTATTAEVISYCQDSWRNATYLDIALLIFSLFISFFFASLAASVRYCTFSSQIVGSRSNSHKDRSNSTCINSRTLKSFELTHPTSPPLPLTLPMESLSNPILQPAHLLIPTLLNHTLPRPTLTATLYPLTITLMVSNLPQTIKIKLVRMERRGIRLRKRYNINIQSW